mgnify:FL=1
MFGTLLAWLHDFFHYNNPQALEIERLRSENARLHADLAEAHAANGQLRKDYEFFYNAFKEGNRARRPDRIH